jgi:4-hydroxy-tetrahydrodipicolinate synthase
MFQGVFTAIVTPFNENGRLDETGLRKNIQFQLANGVDGLVPLGSTGEASTLTPNEKERVIDIVLNEVSGRVPVIVGTGSNSTQTTIESTLQAKKMGAAGALIVTPYYNKPTQEGIYKHFISTADSVDLPIVIYNNPARAAQHISLPTLKRLAAHQNIVSIKDSSGSLLQMMDIYESVCHNKKNFTLLCGDDPLTFSCMAAGGHGVISVASNLVPAAIVSLVAALKSGDYDFARGIHYELLPLFRALFIETNPIPLKAAMHYHEMPAGPCRLPLCEMEEHNKTTLIAALENFSYTLRMA